MVNAERVERQLTPVLGRERAALIASVAEGMDAHLHQNPVIAAMLAPSLFPAIAVLYASSRRITVEGTTLDFIGEEGRADASKTLDEIDRIVEAVNTEDTNPRRRPQTLGEVLLGMGADPLVDVDPGDEDPVEMNEFPPPASEHESADDATGYAYKAIANEPGTAEENEG